LQQAQRLIDQLHGEINKLAQERLPAIPGQSSRLKIARGIARLRASRTHFLRPELFGEPSWDMLLDLYISHLEGRRICVSSLCIAARVPTTTALRYITALEFAGEIERRCDPADGRRFFLSLSDKTLAAMDQWVTEAAQQHDCLA
jgi:DNA-binding MarR family transcriptional regulator